MLEGETDPKPLLGYDGENFYRYDEGRDQYFVLDPNKPADQNYIDQALTSDTIHIMGHTSTSGREADEQDFKVAHGKSKKGDAAYRLGAKIKSALKRKNKNCAGGHRIYVHTCFSGKCDQRRNKYGPAYALRAALEGSGAVSVYGWEGLVEYNTSAALREGEQWVPPHPFGKSPPTWDREKQTTEEWLRKNYFCKRGGLKNVGRGHKKK